MHKQGKADRVESVKQMQFNVKTILIILGAMLLILAGFLLLPILRAEQPVSDAAATPTMKPESPEAPATPTQEAEMKGNLMARAETRADAEKIASQYGITLVMYSDKIALFYTDQDLDALIQSGKKNGWPELSKNNPVTITQS